MTALYLRLAVTALKNNARLYITHILTCTACIMAAYLMVMYRSNTDIVSESAAVYLNNFFSVLLYPMMILFGLIFLYVNGFLIKSRLKEFGVYNILGVNKFQLVRIFLYESVVVFVISIVLGIALGTIFSKALILLLYMIMELEQEANMIFSMAASLEVLIYFGAMFAVCFIINITKILISKATDFLQSSKQGEKEPKVKIILTIIGVVSIGYAYYLANTIESITESLTLMFPLVLTVIAGTYALVIAGSIAVLKFLKSRKKFYYKESNFISISGMLYRMKRNAAGISSICVLSCMFIITIAVTTNLYLGINDITKKHNKELQIEIYEDEYLPKADAALEGVLETFEIESYDNIETLTINILEHENGVVTSEYYHTLYPEAGYSSSFVNVLETSQYNELTGEHQKLLPDEILVIEKENPIYLYNDIDLEAYSSINNVAFDTKYIDSDVFKHFHNTVERVLVVEDFSVLIDNNITGQFSKIFNIQPVDISESDDIKSFISKKEIGFSYSSNSDYREDAIGMYGNFLFAGLFCSVIFLFLVVLIMYYKQITEGYEDKKNFEIMTKVGLSKKMTRKTIRRQILIMFALPMVLAISHILFAYQLIEHICLGLQVVNLDFMPIVLLICISVYFVFYMCAYFVTARTYYRLVS